MNSDCKELLSIFNENHIKYIIVGAQAVMRYTVPRYTKDYDILIESSVENAKKVYKVLKEFGAPLTNIKEDDFANPDLFYIMGVPPNQIDILMSIPGINFSEAWKNKKVFKVSGIEVNYLSKEDLIKAKIAAGRPKDLIDVENLKKSENVKLRSN